MSDLSENRKAITAAMGMFGDSIAPANLNPQFEKQYQVLSSDGLRSYTVSLRQGKWSCSCPQGKFRRKEGYCKHIYRLIDKLQNDS